jgi:hypothetical protein
MSRTNQPSRLALITQTILILAISTWLAAGVTAQERGNSLQSVADMLAVTDGSEVVLYVSDDVSGGIYYTRRPVGKSGPIDFAEFKLLVTTAPKYPRPSGLAYRAGNLFVADREARVVLRINPAADGEKKITVVELPGLLSQPEHIAFSDTDVLAVGSDRTIQYFHPKIGAANVDQGVRDVDRIVFDGRSLLVLDEENAGNVYAVDAHPEFFDSNSRLSLKKIFTDEFRSQLPRIQDFALYRGVYYIAGHHEVLAFPRSQLRSPAGPQPLPLPIPKKEITDIAKVAVSERAIYIAHAKGKAISSIPRYTPVLVDFPNAQNNTVNELPRIAAAMENAKVLSSRTILTDKTYEIVNDLVLDQLFSGPKTFPGPIDSSVTTPFAQMICTLNGWPCEVRKTAQGTIVVKQGGIAGEVTIPNLQVRSFLVEKVSDGTPGVDDLSDFLTQLRIVPLASESNSLSAGDVIRAEKDLINKPAVLGRCEFDPATPPSLAPASFPGEIQITLDEFTKQIGLTNGVALLQKSGVSSVIANYDNVQYETSKRRSSEASKSCLEIRNEQDDPSVYVVDRVIFAQSANYKFLDRKGKSVGVDPKQLSSARVAGAPDVSKQWGWSVRGRLNLGYVGIRFARTEQSTGPVYLRPVFVSIKTYTQQITLLIDAANATNAVRIVNELAVDNPVRFYAAAAQDQVFGVKENSSSPLEPDASPELTFLDVLASRNRLRDLIHFPPDLSDLDLNQVKIGIVEDPSTIEFRHQSFYDDAGNWSWGDPAETDNTNTPSRVPGQIKSAQEYNPDKNREHGTHVAAIIGAKSILPGLIPTARLVKIDVKRLRSEMEDNVSNVQIFNLSSYAPGPDTDDSSLVALIKDGEIGQHDILLIIAAGDENKNFGGAGIPPAPISWLNDLPDKVIVVGTATESAPARFSIRANRSKKYVQLLAPGENVYSATKGNAYAPGTGSSQATPQVTAVAALLRTKNLSAQWIKAVLLYTAEWREDLMEDVWAGILNAWAANAVTEHGKNLVWFSAQGPPVLLTPPKKSYSITVAAGALINDPSQPQATLRRTRDDIVIPFDEVLRVQQMEGQNLGTFRIIYHEKKTAQMTMLLKATIRGGVHCKVLRDADRKPLATDKCSEFAEGNNDDAEIDFLKVVDYMRRVPSGGAKRQLTFPIPGVPVAQR